MRKEIRAVEQWFSTDTVGGLHLLAEWYGCNGPGFLLDQAAQLRRACRTASQQAGLTIVAERFQPLAPPLGIVGTVLLTDSHLIIHTWPESRFATLDVFVCSHCLDNRTKAHALYAALREVLAPGSENFLQIKRGESTEIVRRPH